MLLRKEEAIDRNRGEREREREEERERERERERGHPAEYFFPQKTEETGRPLLLGHVVHPAAAAGVVAAAAVAVVAARRSLPRLWGFFCLLISPFLSFGNELAGGLQEKDQLRWL